MTQLGFALVAPDKTELLGQNLNGIPKENWPTIDAPIKLPKTTHTQISLLQCHSTKHLELGPLHKGNIKYLGHTVSKEGLIPNPKKVDGIRSYSTPKTPTELRRFLRMVSYYCRFVPFFSKVAHLLRIFIEKNQSFSWTEECQEAFNKLKKKLIELHVLHYLDVIMGTDYIETDESVRDLNVILCLKNKREHLRPINFACSGLSTSLPSNGPKRGAIATTENVHAHPQNQMTVRKTPNLGFNEVTDRDTEL
ncbi:MAG: hypothetical protein GY820_09700, partial [Gammaproteobacteria bacterium]|nr:hypothetical protein [Gammaproteobacteria bacterium]